MALILEKSGTKYSTINLSWSTDFAAVARAPLGSATVKSTDAKIEKAQIVRMSGRFRRGRFNSLLCRLRTDGVDCTKNIREEIALKRKTRMLIPKI